VQREESEIQQPSARPDLRAVPEQQQEPVTYVTLLKNRNFRRFFLAQFVSSLGDWIGVIAIAVFADNIGGPTAVGTVMIARVLPGFVVGPLAGVVADRWDRKRTMVYSDIARGLLIFSLPFFENLGYLLVASLVLESLTLIWGPAKDASLPNFVPQYQLTHANSLSLIAVYLPWPLASIAFAFMASFGGFLGEHVSVLEGLQGNPEALALWVDSLTFAFSAFMISRLAITSSRTRKTKLNFGQVKEDLVEGLTFVATHKQVRPWILGIGFTFTAAGGVFSLGVGFVEDVLGRGGSGFGVLIGFLGTGMILGLLVVGVIAKKLQKDVLFTSSLLLSGVSLIAFASMSSFQAAVPIATCIGFFGGAAYSMGYALMQETTRDELRGRTFSAAYTVIRIGTLVGLGLFPFIASAIGDHDVTLFGDVDFALPGSRVTLWFAGLFAIAGGILSMRAIGARETGPGGVGKRGHPGFFVVFEGGEGAGKTTQLEAFVEWLRARGHDVVTSREPGGTPVGEKVRDLLLDPTAKGMDPRTETLLYAADRAQHVAELIRPSLDAGKIVVSDRYVDSSLAYQGIARDLGLQEVQEINEWATRGLVPDLVFYLRVDPKVGLERVGDSPDRIEQENPDFHDRVASAYLQLAGRYPERFVVLDAGGSRDEIHAEIVRMFEERTRDDIDIFEQARDIGGPPGAPVPR
jgi:dTMP kinase